jgi:hypothetical protein
LRNNRKHRSDGRGEPYVRPAAAARYGTKTPRRSPAAFGDAVVLARIAAQVLLLLSMAVIDAAQAHAAPACKPPDTPLLEAQRKFHPGHYISIGPAQMTKGLEHTLSKALGDAIRGVKLRYRWVDLEPTEGQYDFTPIARDLEALARRDLQLVAVIEDKSFNEKPAPTPAYLQAKHTLRTRTGHIAVRWDPFVNQRLQKLIAGIGAEFDCNPNLEGIAIQESAPSLDDDFLLASGYTPEKYRDSLIALLRSASQSLPRSRIFWNMNFLPRGQAYLGEIAHAVTGAGVVMGGPDVLPENGALAERAYPFYETFKGRLPLFCHMHRPSYVHRKTGASGYWSLEDMFVFARDRLHVDYLFWEYFSRPIPPDSRDWSEALAVMARHPTWRPEFQGPNTGQTGASTRDP